MRRTMMCILALLLMLPNAPADVQAKARKDDLKSVRYLPADAVFAGAARIGSLADAYDAVLGFVSKFVPEEEREGMLDPLRGWEEQVGVRLREDLLALMGGEAAIAVAIDDLDRLGMLVASAAQGEGPPDLAAFLGGIVVVVGIDDGARFDDNLAKVFASSGGRLEVAGDGLRTLMDPDDSGFTPVLHYRYHEGFAIWSFAPEAIDAALSRFAAGDGLNASSNFRGVFAHLDRGPDGIGYVNLERLQSLLRSSNLVQAMVAEDPDVAPMYRALVQDLDWGTGIGWATYEIADGTVQQTFAPFNLGMATYGGVFAAIAIPNFLNAVDRGKQKRTMADLRSVAIAIEAYAIDNDTYPLVPEATAVMDSPLPGLLSPFYIRELPLVDGWGHPFLYRSTEDGDGYRVWSNGKDGVPTDEPDGPTTWFDSDIVFENGTFVRWPEGMER